MGGASRRRGTGGLRAILASGNLSL